jgi:hypothetical protein
MGQLGGKLRLTDLTIPATHNSHASNATVQIPSKFKYPPVSGVATLIFKSAECQSLSIVDQLRYGVRMIDLRLGYDLKLRHGLAPLTGTLDEVHLPFIRNGHLPADLSARPLNKSPTSCLPIRLKPSSLTSNGTWKKLSLTYLP